MRRRAVINLCLLAGAIGAMWLPTSAQGPGRRAVERVDGREARAREALVRFRSAPRDTDLDAVTNEVDADAIARVGRTGIYRVRSRNLNAAALIERLSRRGDVEYAEPNYVVTIVGTPNDPSFSSLWGLENTGQPVAGMPGIAGADIHATAAWDVSVGSPNTVVAVIDTGVDYTHQDLAANMWTAPAAFTVDIGGTPVTCAAGTHGFNAILRTCDPMDDHNHGTHVSGTIGAVGNNQLGVVGVNWTTRIMGIKFLDANRRREHRRCDRAGFDLRSKRNRHSPPPPARTSACSRTAGAAPDFRRRCSTRSTRPTRRTCCLSPRPATAPSTTTSCRPIRPATPRTT